MSGPKNIGWSHAAMRTPIRLDHRVQSLQALGSFLLGILAIGASLVDGGLAGPVPVIVMLASIFLSLLLGFRAVSQLRRGNGPVRGSGLAAWGVGMAVGSVFLAFVLPRSTHCAAARRQPGTI